VRKLVVAFVASVVLAAGGCGVNETTAVTVNGHRVTQSSLDDELSAIRDNEEYRTAVEQGLQGRGAAYGVLGQGKGTFSSAFAADVLTRRVYFELVRAEVQRRRLKVTGNDLGKARESLAYQIGRGDVSRGRAILGRFHGDYVDDIAQRQAEVEKLQAVLSGTTIDEAALRRSFDERQEEFAQVCVMHVLVNSKEDADRVRQDLAAGGDFAQLATSRSQDPSAQDNGGDLGCTDPNDYVTEFADVAKTLPIGELSQPLQTQFGWHILKVYERKTPAFAELRVQLRQDLLDAAGSALFEWLDGALARADIDVNPRFGRVSREGGQTQIVPPEAPERASASTTTAAIAIPEE
jgi:foldase protein PrsA